MKDFLIACAKELKSPATTHIAAASAGAITVAFLHRRMMGNGRTLALGTDAFNALVNDEANFIRFTSDKYDHVFHVTLEQ